MHSGDVLQINRRAALDFEDNVFNVLDLFDVAAAADEILRRRDLKDAATDIGVAHLDRTDDVTQRNVVGDQRVWVEIDLILFYKTADGRDFRDTFHRGKRVTEIPILDRAQLGEVMLSAVIDERVFVNPADTGCIGPINGLTPFGIDS